MAEQTTSPVVGAALLGMDFPSAIESIIGGKKATKQEWGNVDIYGVLKDGFLMLHKADGKFYQWIISDGDLQGTDWVIVS